jgi:hypothetical protein
LNFSGRHDLWRQRESVALFQLPQKAGSLGFAHRPQDKHYTHHTRPKIANRRPNPRTITFRTIACSSLVSLSKDQIPISTWVEEHMGIVFLH